MFFLGENERLSTKEVSTVNNKRASILYRQKSGSSALISKLTQLSNSGSRFDCVSASCFTSCNLRPAIKSTTATSCKSVQPLTITGFYADSFSNLGKPARTSKCLTKNPSSKSTPTFLKLSPTKTNPVRWKTKANAYPPTTNYYPDPLHNADDAFLQRVSEISALEVETMRYEKTRKFKKKL